MVNRQWRSKIDNWGGGGGYSNIYTCSQTLKEGNNAEHEYMNMPPPLIIDLPTPL